MRPRNTRSSRECWRKIVRPRPRVLAGRNRISGRRCGRPNLARPRRTVRRPSLRGRCCVESPGDSERSSCRRRPCVRRARRYRAQTFPSVRRSSSTSAAFRADSPDTETNSARTRLGSASTRERPVLGLRGGRFHKKKAVARLDRTIMHRKRCSSAAFDRGFELDFELAVAGAESRRAVHARYLPNRRRRASAARPARRTRVPRSSRRRRGSLSPGRA